MLHANAAFAVMFLDPGMSLYFRGAQDISLSFFFSNLE